MLLPKRKSREHFGLYAHSTCFYAFECFSAFKSIIYMFVYIVSISLLFNESTVFCLEPGFEVKS